MFGSVSVWPSALLHHVLVSICIDPCHYHCRVLCLVWDRVHVSSPVNVSWYHFSNLFYLFMWGSHEYVLQTNRSTYTGNCWWKSEFEVQCTVNSCLGGPEPCSKIQDQVKRTQYTKKKMTRDTWVQRVNLSRCCQQFWNRDWPLWPQFVVQFYIVDQSVCQSIIYLQRYTWCKNHRSKTKKKEKVVHHI